MLENAQMFSEKAENKPICTLWELLLKYNTKKKCIIKDVKKISQNMLLSIVR